MSQTDCEERKKNDFSKGVEIIEDEAPSAHDLQMADMNDTNRAESGGIAGKLNSASTNCDQGLQLPTSVTNDDAIMSQTDCEERKKNDFSKGVEIIEDEAPSAHDLQMADMNDTNRAESGRIAGQLNASTNRDLPTDQRGVWQVATNARTVFETIQENTSSPSDGIVRHLRPRAVSTSARAPACEEDRTVETSRQPVRFHEVEATLAPDEPSVYDGTPVQTSWWRKHIRCMVGGSLLVVAVFAVTVGVGINIKSDETLITVIINSHQPSSSFSPSQNPTFRPSFWPSLSSHPSLASSPPSTYWSTLHWKQQGQEINGEDDDEKDSPAILSSTGMIMAIGSPGPFGNKVRPGYVQIYYRESTGSEWQRRSSNIDGGEYSTIGDEFGASLALSEDGTKLVVGAPDVEHVDSPGYVQVYSLESNSTGSYWNQLGQTLVGDDDDGEYFGKGVSIASDGMTVAIGAPKADGNGTVQVYHIDSDGTGSSWIQIGQTINGEAVGDHSGQNVRLSADGMTLAVGARCNGGRTGHARVYHMECDGSGSSWKQLGQDIDGEEERDNSGVALDLSADGKTVAIGANLNDGKDGKLKHAGHVRVYRREGEGPSSSWEQLGQDIDGEAEGSHSGKSVSISADGKTLVIGSEIMYDGVSSPGLGYARVYSINNEGSSWKQLGKHITNRVPCDMPGDTVKQSVDISSDGKSVAVSYVCYNEHDESRGFRRIRVYALED